MKIKRAEQKEIVLNPEQWQEFTDALDRPVEPCPELRKLLTDPSVLEEQNHEANETAI